MNKDGFVFGYNKRQRKGIIGLLFLVFSFQIVYHYVDFAPPTSQDPSEAFQLLSEKLDTLQTRQKTPDKNYKIHPNFMTDAQGYELGMSVSELDRLFSYRAQKKWIVDLEEFQKITQVDDRLLDKMRAVFYFSKPNFDAAKKTAQPLQKKQRVDLNRATQKDLMKVRGVGPKLSLRILRYKKLLGGFSTEDQLGEVWGLDANVVERLKQHFAVFSKPEIKKISLNTATFKEVLSIVYLDYKTTQMIFRYKDSVGGLSELDALKKIPGFPVKKYDRIALYLQAD